MIPQDAPIPDGFELIQTLRGHGGWPQVTSVAWSPDGKRLLAGYMDGSLVLWDAIDGERLAGVKVPDAGITAASFTPDGRFVVSGTSRGAVVVWDAATLARRVDWHEDRFAILTVAASAHSDLTLSGSADGSVRVGHFQTKVAGLLHYSEGFAPGAAPSCMAISPNHLQAVLGRWDGSVSFLDLRNLQSTLLAGHAGLAHGTDAARDGRFAVEDIVITPDGRQAVSASTDRTIKVWQVQQPRELLTLEGHTGPVRAVDIDPAGQLMASKSIDDTIRIWDCRSWRYLTSLPEKYYSGTTVPEGRTPRRVVAFDPSGSLLATLDENKGTIRVWRLDRDTLLGRKPPAAERPSRYANAKVVLVGDSGMGKSGLGLVLSGQPFAATESTHGRRVHVFSRQTVKLDGPMNETRETLLWDLAGQPGYRLIHQLHLNEVAVALLVFDARSETDPLAGVRHWDRALRQAQRLQGEAHPPLKKFLVAARADRGGVGLTGPRVEKLREELGFDGYFETSAKEGWQVAELMRAVAAAIPWERLPKVNSTRLFQAMKTYLASAKESGRLLATADDLLAGFQRAVFTGDHKGGSARKWTGGDLLRHSVESGELRDDALKQAFDTCVGRVESRGLVRRLGFGNVVLLQPEMLDAYASALINAAKDEPDGQGCVAEDDARDGNFRMPSDERIKDREQEKLLCIATVQDLLRHDIALREQTDAGAQLVFPSQFTRDWPDAPSPHEQAVVFRFAGPVLNVYATLAVRLAHSGLFVRREMWRNAATYSARVAGVCGLFLRELGDGLGELSLFFDVAASEETRFQFEAFVEAHLRRRALPETIQRRRAFRCPTCGEPVPDQTVEARRKRRLDWAACAGCDGRVSLRDGAERLAADRARDVALMDKSADLGRDRAVAASLLQGKIETRDFDVFLCHNGLDKPQVREIALRLKERGLLPWLDEWELQPGLPWVPALEKQIETIRAAAVFFGPHGPGGWQEFERAGFLQHFLDRKCPVIPVILPTCDEEPKVSVFLKGLTWVDFRKSDPDPLERLIWGITGQRRSE